MALSDQVWWERFDRAADAKRREGPEGSKLLSDHTHAVLALIGDAEEGLEIIPGPAWQPVPAERRTDEYVAAETRRLNDELGQRLGIGPMP